MQRGLRHFCVCLSLKHATTITTIEEPCVILRPSSSLSFQSPFMYIVVRPTGARFLGTLAALQLLVHNGAVGLAQLLMCQGCFLTCSE